METPQAMIAILAGGESRRMGQDKAAMLWNGRSFLEGIAVAACSVSPDVAVIGRTRPGNWSQPSIAFLPDTEAGEGPLRGLEAALCAAGSRPVLLLACDMPLLTADALRWLLGEARAREPLEQGLVAVNEGRLEPLFSVYAPECLPLVREALASGRRSLHGMIQAGRFSFADVPAEVAARIANINTPEELARVSMSWNLLK